MWAVLTNRGSAISPKWTNSYIFQQNPNLKGVGQLYETKCQLLYLGPHIAGHSGLIMESANQPKLDQFKHFQQFSIQNQIELVKQ